MIDTARFAALVDQRMLQVIDRERENYGGLDPLVGAMFDEDRKSTRLNSSH